MVAVSLRTGQFASSEVIPPPLHFTRNDNNRLKFLPMTKSLNDEVIMLHFKKASASPSKYGLLVAKGFYGVFFSGEVGGDQSGYQGQSH